SNAAVGIHAVGSNVYVSTPVGVSISTNGGSSFTNYTSGLGSTNILGAYASGSKVYAATNGGGIGVSTDGGISYTAYNNANSSLMNDSVYGIYAIGNNVYAATSSGMSVSVNGGINFTANFSAASVNAIIAQ
ncbi:MAG TPA: hypothetical protein PKA14_23010, partial [Leptospiraceae bacterium]|nr:hypothetical protein [Leptospiraceae bacterium]